MKERLVDQRALAGVAVQYFELGFFFQIKQQKGRKPPRMFMLGMSFADTGLERHMEV